MKRDLSQDPARISPELAATRVTQVVPNLRSWMSGHAVAPPEGPDVELNERRPAALYPGARFNVRHHVAKGRLGRLVATHFGIDDQGLGAALDDLGVDHHLFDALIGGQFEHGLQQDGFHDRA